MKALTKSVEDRYQSAAAMRADIERYLAGKPVAAPVVPAAAAVAAADASQTSMFSGPVAAAEEPRTKRWPLVATIIGVLLVLGLGAVLGPMLLDSGPEDKTVPEVVNLTQAQAERRIERAGLSVGEVSQEASEDVPKGRVIAQDPDPLSTLPADDPVDLTVSTGQPDVVVPDVIGDDKDDRPAEGHATPA